MWCGAAQRHMGVRAISRVHLVFLYTYRSCTKGQEKLVLLSSHKAPLNTEVRGKSDPDRSASGSPPVDP